MPRIIYIHVPKCGGSSFGAALRLRYFMSQAVINLDPGDPALPAETRILADYARRRAQLHQSANQGIRMISGHVQYDPELHDRGAKNYTFVTLLRDPVVRFVSHYNYLQRRHPTPSRPATLAGFLDTADAARLASQYLFYFAGQSLLPGQDPAPLVARATAALARFDIIGDLSQPHIFAKHLQRHIGTPLPLWRRNVAPVPTEFPANLRPKIETLCAADIAVYQAVQITRIAA
ncbi:sulfotransferase family 2 domain-containing protein [Sulfitobacter dubius]|uniref:sulfotransferase family 2 domain-containing protein n=1 Tax=Sulfitobacter dubius TaxID=218673 RepID=UPI0008F255B0|nr:sulfotransferase family 2 domain-containing protein [Sulfitobacter dubius]SFH35361.1 Sulfotransferase family protein [Sulfitobacter dubius]